MTTTSTILTGWSIVALVMFVLWFVQRSTRNAGIVDIAWAFGTGALGAWFAWMAEAGDLHRRLLIGAMASIWGIRLGSYLIRRVLSEAEDGRYQELRQSWGTRVQIYLFAFFQIQALWAVLFALPMWAAANNPSPGLRWSDWVGFTIWLISLAGESVADRQLAQFRSEESNRGKVCDTGLWRYSRHPNYFFEWLHWWAYVFLGWGGALWWITLCGPAVMLLFLFKITGIPPTEKRALVSRGEAYRRYQETTSAFFPWPPRETQGK